MYHVRSSKQLTSTVGSGKVLEEVIKVRVGVDVDGCTSTSEVGHGGGWDGHLDDLA